MASVDEGNLKLQLGVNGLDNLKEAMNVMTKFKENLKGINVMLDHSKTAGIGDGLSKNFNEAHNNAERLTSSVRDSQRATNDLKRSAKEVNETTDKSPKNIDKFKDSTDKAGHSFKRLHDVIWGSFIGNTLSNAISDIGSGLLSAAKNGIKLVEGGAQITSQWKNIGVSNKGIKELTDQIGDIRSKSDMSGGAIDSMQKKLYAVTNSVPKTKELTNAIASFGFAAGKTGDQISQMGQGVAKLLGSKTVSSGFFNRAFGSMPALQKQIEKASGMTHAAFEKALQGSKITGSQLQGYLIKAAKKSSVEWAAFGKTTQGKIAGLKGTWQNMTADFAKPVVLGVSNALKGLSKHDNGIKSLTKNIKSLVTSMGAKVGHTVGKAVAFLVKDAKPIGEIASSIFKIVKNLAAGPIEVIAAALRLVGNNSNKAKKGINGTASGLKRIAKHTKTIKVLGTTIVSLWAAVKLVTAAQKVWNIVAAMNPYVAIAAAIAAVVVGLVELYKHNKKFRKWCNGIAKSAKGLFKDITKGLSKAGKVISNIWNGIKKYTGKVAGSMWKSIKDEFNNGKKVTINSQNTFNDLIHFRWNRLGKDVSKLAGSLWKLVKEAFTDGFKVVNNLTGGRLGDMIKGFQNAWKGIGKDWHDFWNGVDKWFSNLWQGIVKHVQNGINDVIKIINDGIGGIDSAIHMFGGSSNAIGKISPVHLATGTGRRPINKPTFALLNDGHDSPETGNREMIMHANGAGELVKGTNVHKILEPGAEVFNASETKQLMEVPFAKGTGFFGGLVKGTEHIGSSIAHAAEHVGSSIVGTVGSVLSKTKKTFNLIKNIIKDPSKVLSGVFAKPKGNSTLTNDLVGGMASKVTSAAGKWWSDLWGMVHGGSGGDATGLLAAVEKYGRGKRYVWGAAGPSTFDCSGLVMYALKHAFGISYPHFSGAQYEKADHISRSSAKPGDLVFWGPSKHVGVFAGGNRYWSAFAPNGHPDIGMHSISGSVPGYSPLFAKVKGLSQKTKSDKSKKSNNGLAGLIKGQVGKGFFKFVDGILSKFEDNGDMGAVGLAGDESQRAREIAKALKQAYPSATDAGIAGILGNWMQESRLSPSAIDPADHGTGLGQWTFGRETGLRNWLKKHGYAWDSAKGQLEYALHEPGESGAFKSVLRMSSPAEAARKFFAGWESGGNEDQTGGTRTSNAEAAYKAIKGHAKGGHINRSKLSIVGEKGWELFKPDTAGTIISHDKSEKLISGKSNAKPVSIDARTYLTVSSDVSDSTLKKIDKILEKRNNDLAEKRADLAGLNDADGLII